MKGKRKLWMLVSVLTVGTFVLAQEAPKSDKAPALSTEQKQAVQIQLQKAENAQLRMQLAAADFEKAKAEIGRLVASYQVPGYDLNLETMTYTKVPAKPASKQQP